MNRLEKKRAARERQTERKHLVHAAGCNHADCSSKWFVANPEWTTNPGLVVFGIKVPRSLRSALGLRTGDR